MRCNLCWKSLTKSSLATVLPCKHIFCEASCALKVKSSSKCPRCLLPFDSRAVQRLGLSKGTSASLCTLDESNLIDQLATLSSLKEFQCSQQLSYITAYYRHKLEALQKELCGKDALLGKAKEKLLEARNSEKNMASKYEALRKNFEEVNAELAKMSEQNKKFKLYISRKTLGGPESGRERRSKGARKQESFQASARETGRRKDRCTAKLDFKNGERPRADSFFDRFKNSGEENEKASRKSFFSLKDIMSTRGSLSSRQRSQLEGKNVNRKKEGREIDSAKFSFFQSVFK